MNEDFWAKMPQCDGCGYHLCFLDRQYDECPMCGHEIPTEHRVD